MLETSTIPYGPHGIRLIRGGIGRDLVLIHGIGPGTSILANFEPVLEVLARSFRVTGIDLIGFGGSSRKKEAPFFDTGLWVEQVLHVLQALDSDRIALLGHSAGGAIALKVAARDRRVSEVVSSAGVGSALTVNRYLDRFWRVPSSIAELGEMVAGTVFDASRITDDALRMRFEAFRDESTSRYFAEMFGYDKQALMNTLILDKEELARISSRVLFLHGRNDLPCPVDDTALRLWPKLESADLLVLGRCGHSIPREAPQRFVQAVRDFLLN